MLPTRRGSHSELRGLLARTFGSLPSLDQESGFSALNPIAGPWTFILIRLATVVQLRLSALVGQSHDARVTFRMQRLRKFRWLGSWRRLLGAGNHKLNVAARCFDLSTNRSLRVSARLVDAGPQLFRSTATRPPDCRMTALTKNQELRAFQLSRFEGKPLPARRSGFPVPRR